MHNPSTLQEPKPPKECQSHTNHKQDGPSLGHMMWTLESRHGCTLPRRIPVAHQSKCAKRIRSSRQVPAAPGGSHMYRCISPVLAARSQWRLVRLGER